MVGGVGVVGGGVVGGVGMGGGVVFVVGGSVGVSWEIEVF